MKNLKLMNILPMALGVAVGFIVYKMVAKMIGDQDEVEAMLSARGSIIKRPGVQKAVGGYGYCRCCTTPTFWTRIGLGDVSCRDFDSTPQPCDKHCKSLGLTNVDIN